MKPVHECFTVDILKQGLRKHISSHSHQVRTHAVEQSETDPDPLELVTQMSRAMQPSVVYLAKW